MILFISHFQDRKIHRENRLVVAWEEGGMQKATANGNVGGVWGEGS